MGHVGGREKTAVLRAIQIYDHPVQELSEGRNIFVGPRDCSCDILTGNVVVLCPCLKYLPKAKLKSYGLTSLTKEILTQPSTDWVA